MLQNKLKLFKFFYHYLGLKVFFSMVLTMAVGLLDGFGLSMFLPLLKFVSDSEGEANSSENFKVIDQIFYSIGVEVSLYSILTLMIFFFILKGLFKYYSMLYNVSLHQQFIRIVRLDLLKSFGALKYEFFVSMDNGRVQNTMTAEVDKVAQSNKHYFASIEHFIMISVYMGFAFMIDWQFALLIATGGFLSNLLFKRLYYRTKQNSRNLTKSNHIYQGLILQFISSFQYLKATGYKSKYEDKLVKSINSIEKTRKSIGKLNAILQSIREPLMLIIVAGVILIQVNILGGQLSAILLSLLFFYRALNSLTSFQSSWNSFLSVSGSVENIISFRLELDKEKEGSGKIKVNNFNREIELQNISFSYGAKEILSNVNLKVNKNESIALVGESGGGKTTLTNILVGLLEPTSGLFLIDSVNSKKIQLESYQSRIGYITQEPSIFADTIFNNVTLWDNVNSENIEKCNAALERAAMLNTIQESADGINTMLGFNGVNLSGGQKQRLAISRELYKDIDIFVLDEATSALDSETESFIQEKIDEVKGKMTLIIIAHRLSTIKNVDRIYVMEAGEIIAQGSYEELARNDVKFKRMLAMQGMHSKLS